MTVKHFLSYTAKITNDGFLIIRDIILLDKAVCDLLQIINNNSYQGR